MSCAPSPQSSALRTQLALQEFQHRRSEGTNTRAGRTPVALSQRASSSLQELQSAASYSGTSKLSVSVGEQLPRWYLLLRQSVQDLWRIIALVYKLASHALGSLFEV